jgi:succinoglycan biosynthesis protein ExoA
MVVSSVPGSDMSNQHFEIPSNPRVLLVIPCLNEAKTIEAL